MKVILLEEVTGKGHEGDVIDVARGFAVNYLYPRRLAVEATAGNLKQLEARKSNIEKRESTRKAEAAAFAAQLEGKTITIEAKAGEEGRLFGSVTAQMIQDAVLDQLDVEVDRKKMDVGAHIKDIGDHEVSVRFGTDTKANVTVKVVPEGGEVSEEVSFADDAERALEQLEAAQAAAEAFEADAAAETDEEAAAEDAVDSDDAEASDEAASDEVADDEASDDEPAEGSDDE